MDLSDSPAGFDNSGNIIIKNRKYRRRKVTTSDLDGLPRSYYTTKQTKKRKRNGKTTKIRKKSRK